MAYVSQDFREHPVAQILADLFEDDRTRFEPIAIALGRDNQSEIRARLKLAFDRFIDVNGKSDRDVAQLIRELKGLDVVDLMGPTRGGRPRDPVVSSRADPGELPELFPASRARTMSITIWPTGS